MRLPRDLSGTDLIAVLCREFGYQRVHQVGSHVILQRENPHHRIAVPDHNPLRVGTLNSILRAVATTQNIDKKQILRFL
jgi:predicted RNA binding protein YcfA (HicA-like mRNA interferase family)